MTRWPNLVTRSAMLGLALLAVGVVALGAVRNAFAASSPFTNLPDSVAPQVQYAHLTGTASGSQTLHLVVSLRSRNATGLQDYATQVAQPKSKLFHQYLTPAQFAQTFGAEPTALHALESYLQQQGFHLDSVASGGLLVQVTGTVAQAESAFHTHINDYSQNGRSFYANATAAEVPSVLAPFVVNVAGLETARVSVPSVALATQRHTVTVPTPTFSGAGPYTFQSATPAVLDAAYSIPTTGTPGQGVWTAFIEYDGYSLADLAQYAHDLIVPGTLQTAITASATSLNPLIITQNVSGGYAALPAAGANFGTALPPGANALQVEGELETYLGLVPNVQNISVIQTANTAAGTLLALSTVANQDAAQVVGDSWGMCEPDAGFAQAQAEEQIFMQMALQGQSMFATTGNNGLYACYGDGNGLRQYSFNVMDPASDPFVTAVGGTELGVVGNTALTATWSKEQPWTNTIPSTGLTAGLGGAGGGGISQFWGASAWQISSKTSLTAQASTGVLSVYASSSPAARVVPDVSAAADPLNSGIAVYCTVGSFPCTTGAATYLNIGGTAEADAIWLASATLAVQAANPNANPPQVGVRVGLVAPLLYNTYAGGQSTDAKGSVAFSGIVVSSFTATVANGFQQPPGPASTAIYGGGAGFSVDGTPVYNALTGLGSPLDGILPADLAKATRLPIPRTYMVSQAASNGTYWLGSYAFNSYVANVPVSAQWYQLSSQVFTGQPTIVDDGKFGGVATNLYIIGPAVSTTSGVAIIDWNIATQTATDITNQENAIPPSIGMDNTTCASVSAFSDATTSNAADDFAVYCVTPAGNLYTDSFVPDSPTKVQWTGALSSWLFTALSNVRSAPQVANDGNGNYLVAFQQTNSNNIEYQYFTNGFDELSEWLAEPPSFVLKTLATTCNSVPAIAYDLKIAAFAAACIASDTHAMWANFFNTSNTAFNTQWNLLGQPSSSVTFMPGDAVAIDNVAGDPGYGEIVYVAEGSDKAMYLSVVNTANSNFLDRITGWQAVSTAVGIFNNGVAADFTGA